MFLLALRHFFLFRPRVFSRVLGSVARREPARTSRVSLGPGRGPWYVLWGLKVACPLGEGFRARRAIQAHSNPRTYYLWYFLTWVKKCLTAHEISRTLNVVNVARHYLVTERYFPDT